MQGIVFIIGVFTVCMPALIGQTDQWTKVSFGNLQCEFPAAYSPISYSGVGGIYYDGGNLYLTVTAQPDTSKMKGNLNRDYTRDFMNIVLDVSRRLNGKVREFRDTAIANMPGYISKQEVRYPDGRRSYYELLQLLQQDTMRSFSAQYFVDDTNGMEASRRFFRSISVVSESPSPRFPGKLGFLFGGAVLLIGAWLVWRKKS